MTAAVSDAAVADDASQTPLLQLHRVSRVFDVKQSAWPLARPAHLVAVDAVDLAVMPGRTVGVVGESGSGKSTLGRVAVRLLAPSSGTVSFEGRDITRLAGGDLRRLRARMQVVFQDPLASLDPRRPVGETVAEPLQVLAGMSGGELRDRVAELLESVGLRAEHGRRRPRDLSGGQRQRVGIARAIPVSPRLVLADEAVSALDVSVAAQVVNLFAELAERLGLTYLFIAHGLPVVRQIADRVAVMYLGRIVESGPTEAVFADPAHPYTRALLAAAPSPDPRNRGRRTVVSGEPPSLLSKPSGCRFRTRCPLAQDVCAEVDPPDVDLGDGRLAACHFAGAV